METKLKNEFALRGGNMILVAQPAGSCINYYAIDKKWLEQNWPDYFDDHVNPNHHENGISLIDRIIATALLEKKMGFMFQPYCANPFTFPLSDGKADGYRAFADVLAQLLEASGQHDAAKMIDAMMGHSSES